MLHRVQLAFILFSCIMCGFSKSPKENAWKYEIISIKTHSSDESVVKIDLKPDRIGRERIYLTGFLDVNTEVVDGCLLDVKFFCSKTGNLNFRQLPFELKNSSVFHTLNNAYKEYIMDGLKGCSNMPQFDNMLTAPLPPKNYTLNKCKISSENFNVNLPSGFYKCVITGSGKWNWVAEVVVKGEGFYF